MDEPNRPASAAGDATAASPVSAPPAAAQKQALRQRQRQLRRQSLPAAAADLVAVARRQLPGWLAQQPVAAGDPAAGPWLGFYWPIGSEPDLRPLIAPRPLPCWPAAPAVQLALPAIVPWQHQADAPGTWQGRRLVYLPWSPGETLVKDACGIPAPAWTAAAGPEPLAAADLALLLVPALGFDPASGIRLGSGGGWYDRLRADPAWRAVPTLAVLPSACLLPDLPADPWDLPLGGWLDERGIHRVASAA